MARSLRLHRKGRCERHHIFRVPSAPTLSPCPCHQPKGPLRPFSVARTPQSPLCSPLFLLVYSELISELRRVRSGIPLIAKCAISGASGATTGPTRVPAVQGGNPDRRRYPRNVGACGNLRPSARVIKGINLTLPGFWSNLRSRSATRRGQVHPSCGGDLICS